MSDQERELRVILLDGSEVIINTGDSVLFQASRPGAIPLSVDADTIIDDVLAALTEAQQTIAQQREALEWYAKPENYEIGNYTSMRGEIPTDWESRIQQEAGEKARATIGEGAKANE